MRPAFANLADNASDLVPGAVGRVPIGASEFGRQQVPAGEDVQRQIAIAVVESVEVPAFLHAMDRIVGGVDVDDQLAWRLF